MEEYIGVIKLFAGNFAPQNYALCNGALLNIAQNQALFAVIGTLYGGNGVQTFALPNLNGRVAVGAGQGAGLPNVTLGQAAGTATTTLLINNMPAHTHSLMGSTGNATASSPTGGVLAASNGQDNQENPVTVNTYGPATNMTPASPAAIGTAGSNQPVSIMQPYLGLNYIICTNGIFPSRN